MKIRKKMSMSYLLGASALMLLPLPALAQQIEEVVVTAQKREQNLQDVPITVTALSADSLRNAGVTGTRDLALVTPGLVFANNTAAGSPSIRGVSTRGLGPGDEPSVPIYIDGVYQSTTLSGFFQFNNIERIEVLKGPQGTLFGRNALGGAINVITLNPSFEPEARVDASYGSDNEVHTNIYASSGISETVAASIAYHLDRRDGFIDHIVTGRKLGKSESEGVRSKLLWTPSDRMEVVLGAHYLESNDNTAFAAYPILGNTAGKTIDPGTPIARPGKTAVNDVFFEVRQVGASAQLSWELDGFDLTALQSWLDTKSRLKSDSDASYVDYAYATYPSWDESYSTEVRLSSNGDSRLSWVSGLYYFKDDASYPRTPHGHTFMARSTPTGVTLAVLTDIGTEAYSAFGEATYELTDALSITGGLRYSYEEREKRNYQRSLTPHASLPEIVPPAFMGGADTSFEDVSFRASLQYEFTPWAKGFFTFSQGFKSGFFNASSAPPFFALEPEEVDNYEIGVKMQPTDNTRLNITAFYMEYDNLQVSARSPSGTATTDVFNAAAATNYGGEVELEWMPIVGLNIKGGLAYQHARYDEFENAVAYFALTDTDTSLVDRCQQGAGNLLGGNRSEICSANGGQLGKSPDWTANLATSYAFPAFGGTMTAGGILYWSDDFVWDLVGNVDNGGPHTVLNAHLSWFTSNDRFGVSLYGNNLTDSDHPLNRYQTGSATYGVDARPRHYGIRFSYQL